MVAVGDDDGSGMAFWNNCCGARIDGHDEGDIREGGVDCIGDGESKQTEKAIAKVALDGGGVGIEGELEGFQGFDGGHADDG